MAQQAGEGGQGAVAVRPLLAIGVMVAFALSAWLSLRDNAPPAPRGDDAPADAFSATRAQAVLARVLGDEAPHPTGSAANAAVRDRIVAEFATLGLAAEVQRRYVCGTSNCATVENILARVPGASPERAVLLSAHYDSVAAGPGAGDDGAGVAALIETARALKAGPPLPHDVWLLVNDGEEIDLLGAEAFVREPQFARVAHVVNVEARGTEGASLLIETQRGNAAVIESVSRALRDPAGSSLDYEIYKALPNDTDFTVYRREGRSGTSFALARGAARYHTPLDDLAHLSPGSLQHHGDNLLGMARAFATTEGSLERGHDAVFFSLAGIALASWPVTWNLALLVLGGVAWIALVVRLVRGGDARPVALVAAAFALTLLPLVAGAFGYAMHELLAQRGAMPAPWTAQETMLVAAFAGLALALLGLLAGFLVRRLGAATVGVASLVPFALIACATVSMAPGASHVGLLPLLAGALAGVAMPRRPVAWAGLAGVVAAMLWFPYVADLYMALGDVALPGVSLLMALAALPLLPAIGAFGTRAKGFGLAALAATAAFVAIALVRPAFDADVPRPANLVYVGSGAQARVYVNPFGALPEGFLAANGFDEKEGLLLPWSQLELSGGPAGPVLAAPTIDVVADETRGDRRHVQLRVRSQRGSTEAGLRLPGAIDFATVTVDGEKLQAPRHEAPAASAYHGVSRIAMGPEGALFAFEADAGEAIELYAVDLTHGLPEELAGVVRARDAVAVPIHNGDTTLAWTKLSLPAK
jgi:hypothetical protein